VSWDLVARRGQTLSIAIEDDLTTNPWGYIAASGFDVVRVVTPELHEGLAFLRTRPYDIDLSPVENWPFTEVASAIRLTRTTNPRVR
jgi:transposase